MKKTVLSLLIFSTLTFYAAEAYSQPTVQNSNTPTAQQIRQERKREFEQRLNLTETQKTKASEIHKQGREQIKPLMIQIAAKQQEIETVKLSRISEKMQQERIAELNAEIKELQKQAQEIRKKNTQEFEKILDKKQKAELEKMKAEGRLKFEQNHPPRAPFGGLGTPAFMLKPNFITPQNSGLK